MGSPFLLSQAESCKWRSHGRIAAAECLLVVDAVHVISVGEIMVYAKRSQISGRVDRHQSLEQFSDSAVRSID